MTTLFTVITHMESVAQILILSSGVTDLTTSIQDVPSNSHVIDKKRREQCFLKNKVIYILLKETQKYNFIRTVNCFTMMDAMI